MIKWILMFVLGAVLALVITQNIAMGVTGGVMGCVLLLLMYEIQRVPPKVYGIKRRQFRDKL